MGTRSGRNVGEDDFVGELKVWDLDDSSPALVLRGHDAAVKHVVVSADGEWIASGDTNGAVCVWEVNGQLQRVLGTRDDAVCGIAFTDQCRRLVVADNAGLVWWNIQTGEKSLTVDCQDDQRYENRIIAFGGDQTGDRLAYYTRQAVHVLDAYTKQPICVIPDSASGLAFGTDQQFALTYFHDMHGELKTFDLSTGRQRIHVQTEHIGNPFRTGWGLLDAAFSPDGRRVVAVGNNGPGLVWDTRTGRLLMELAGHSSFIWAVAYHPDGTRIATGSWDNAIKLWDAATGREMMTLRGHEEHIHDLAFSPCGKYLVSGSEDKTVRIWNAAPESAIAGSRIHEKSDPR